MWYSYPVNKKLSEEAPMNNKSATKETTSDQATRMPATAPRMTQEAATAPKTPNPPSEVEKAPNSPQSIDEQIAALKLLSEDKEEATASSRYAMYGRPKSPKTRESWTSGRSRPSFNWADVENIRRSLEGVTVLAKKYKVTRKTIYDILNMKTWKIVETKD